MSFKFIHKKDRVIGESKNNFILKSTNKEVTKLEAIRLLKSGKWGGFKNFAFEYKCGKYYYGMKRLGSFEALLSAIAKNSKRKTTIIYIYN